ncbi:VirB4 family type IV secretion system protein [Haladaptatus sp. CMAA 1911]|uniref:VirB4 family type IV secretion system protein n=1 Tax=unclassified Haladaptatus TaxID=2622732 RepID=UPI003753FEED
MNLNLPFTDASDDNESDDEPDGTDEPAVEPDADSPSTDAKAVAAAGLQIEPNAVQMTASGRWAVPLVITNWPQFAYPGMLEQLTTHPSTDVDLSIHADPSGTDKARRRFDSAIRDLQALIQSKKENGDPSVDQTQRRMNEHREVLSALSRGETSAFDVTVVITVRADSHDAVLSEASTVRSELQKQQITAEFATHNLLTDGLLAGSPLVDDAIDAPTTMLSGAVGCLMPWSAGTIFEERGILAGYHATTDEPLVVNRWNRSNGYNIFTAGRIGAGKSFGTKLLNLREVAKDPDTILVMIDPLSGFSSLADSLKAENVVVGGSKGINPLEIRRTPQHVLDNNPQLNPFGERFSSVMGFFESFFAHVDSGDNGLNKGERAVLDLALGEAYARHGITTDPETHSNPSPTIAGEDGIDQILGEIADDGGAFIQRIRENEGVNSTVTDLEGGKIEEHAADLRNAMMSFIGGEFSNLSGESDIDIRGKDAVYLDLQQGEGSSGIGLMVQLLFDSVYERAKETDKNVIMAIDEAHYLMQNQQLDWLELAVRHSRHHDLSLHFITQEAKDFFVHEKAETIANNCAIRLLHRLPDLSEENRKKLDLTEREGEFVRNALPGTRSRGFSHALMVVDDETEVAKYPTKVSALEKEAEIIENHEEREERFERAKALDTTGGDDINTAADASESSNTMADVERSDRMTAATDGGVTND